MTENKPIAYLTNEETDKISRTLLAWINLFPNKPVRTINYEYLEADVVSMALSTIQAAYKTRQYIAGGFQAQYQFKIVYRLQPTSNDGRLNADEVLNALGDWASSRENIPYLGGGKRALRVECDTRSSLINAYNDGSEDHQILMKLIYEVI